MSYAADSPPSAVDHGSLDWLLTTFANRVPSIVYALAVSVDGLPLAASERMSQERTDQLSAITSGMSSLTVGAAKCLTTGQVRQTIVDMDGGVLLIMAVADRALLAVLAEAGCDLGQVGYETAVLSQRVASALEPGARSPGQL